MIVFQNQTSYTSAHCSFLHAERLYHCRLNAPVCAQLEVRKHGGSPVYV